MGLGVLAGGWALPLGFLEELWLGVLKGLTGDLAASGSFLSLGDPGQFRGVLPGAGQSWPDLFLLSSPAP